MPGAVVGCFGLAHGSHGRKQCAHLRAARPLPGRMWGVRGGSGACWRPAPCGSGACLRPASSEADCESFGMFRGSSGARRLRHW
ncbi:hypothetical protein HMPREF9005_0303 [Actinomyces sp. oral taxon 178 str. F0338]|nr:hypothetical protein HMPREF9005_0303 [Actinomyces sp. oral taxon 178 str. F0338]